MKHTEWLNKLSKSDAIHAIAQRAKIVPRTFARQVERGEISAENVIAIAVAYNTHPVRALVDTEYLDEEYARTVDPVSAIRMVSEEQLADEALRRMKLGVKTDVLTTDINDLAARRAGAPVSDADGSMPLSAVAYNGPDEDAERNDADDD